MKCAVTCNAAFLLVMVSIIVGSTHAKLEEPIQVDETGEGSRCDQDKKVADVCLACSKLPFDGNTPLVSCCSDENAYLFCEACVGDQASCLRVLQEMSELEQYDESDVYNDDNPESVYDAIYDEDDVDDRNLPMNPLNKLPEIDKRFGTLFMTSPKRYGRLIYGKRGSPYPLYFEKDDVDSQEFKGSPDKRFGRLYMGSGSYFGKRDIESSQFKGNPDKRFGRLYMGSGSYFGKRDMESSQSEETPDKRFGRLYMGSGGSYFGKRNSDSSPNFEAIPDKRFGRLYMNSGSYFGKRDDGSSSESGEDVDKRFGRLFIKSGSYFGKRNQGESVFDDNVDKRFGRLYMGSGSYLGKRSFGSDNEGLLTDAEKRSFMFRKRGPSDAYDEEDHNMDKRYGRIFMNSRQGRHRWFGKR